MERSAAVPKQPGALLAPTGRVGQGTVGTRERRTAHWHSHAPSLFQRFDLALHSHDSKHAEDGTRLRSNVDAPIGATVAVQDTRIPEEEPMPGATVTPTSALNAHGGLA